jgi:signal transduction histidine kinase
MSPERLSEIQSEGAGVGIRGMRERVRHLRGDLVIESNEYGPKVCATLPLTMSLSPYKSNAQQVVTQCR